MPYLVGLLLDPAAGLPPRHGQARAAWQDAITEEGASCKEVRRPPSGSRRRRRARGEGGVHGRLASTLSGRGGALGRRVRGPASGRTPP